MKQRSAPLGLSTIPLFMSEDASPGLHTGVPPNLPQAAIAGDLPLKQIRRTVVMAAVIRNWRLTNGHIHARHVDPQLPRREHDARLRVDYSTSPPWCDGIARNP